MFLLEFQVFCVIYIQSRQWHICFVLFYIDQKYTCFYSQLLLCPTQGYHFYLIYHLEWGEACYELKPFNIL